MSAYEDLGFRWAEAAGEVRISRFGKVVTVLRGDAAREFLAEAQGVTDDELQQLLARLTGNYKRGNERQAADHPRNRK